LYYIIIYSSSLIISFIISFYYFSDILILFLSYLPFSSLYFFNLAEAFFSTLSFSFFISFLWSSPLFCFFLFLYLQPALYSYQAKLFLYYIFYILCFILPFYFIIFVPKIWPILIKFFYSFTSTELNYLGSINNIFKSFYNFSWLIIFLFQFPIFSNIVIPYYVKNRYLFIMILLIIYALITPPDVVSLLIITIPTIIMLEIMIYWKL